MRHLVISAKRKTAIARAYFRDGKGVIRINNFLLDVWSNPLARARVKEALIIAKNIVPDVLDEIDINVDVKGSGWQAQAEAVRQAIARGLVIWTGNNELKKAFLEYDNWLLVNDPRRKEQNKSLRSKPRAWRQTSYR